MHSAASAAPWHTTQGSRPAYLSKTRPVLATGLTNNITYCTSHPPTARLTTQRGMMDGGGRCTVCTVALSGGSGFPWHLAWVEVWPTNLGKPRNKKRRRGGKAPGQVHIHIYIYTTHTLHPADILPSHLQGQGAAADAVPCISGASIY